MSVLTPEKALRSLRKTPPLLDVLLRGLSQRDAEQATDGPDGWSVVFIVCHMRDYEGIYAERVRWMVEQDVPEIPAPLSNDELIRIHDYTSASLREALEDYLQQRKQFIGYLVGLTADQWQRTGIIGSGESTVQDIAINAALHDINHLDQIVKAMEMSQIRV